MGEVYRAEDLFLNRIVALKLLPEDLSDDPVRVWRFINEGKIASTLLHPHVAVIYEAGQGDDGRPFIAMEYVDGCTLGAKIDSGSLPPLEVLKIGAQVAGALDEAHSRNIIHRDIKPGNIMLTRKGKAKVLDFGLAKVREPVPGTPIERLPPHPGTTPGMVVGTLPYMSPEQLLGREIDHRSDIFSFGTVLYELATGRRPFDGDTVAAVQQSILHTSPPPPSELNPSVTPELEGVILKALEKDREQRYQSASDMEIRLSELVHRSSPWYPTIPYPTVLTQAWPRRLLYALVALTLCAVALLVLEFSRPGTLRGLLGNSPSGGKHLVVLPIKNLSNDPAAQVVCDGLVDYITARLTMLQQFRGSPTVEPFTLARQPEVRTIQDARKAFGATLAIDGSLNRQGSRARLMLNLIDARTLHVLRSAVIDDEAANVFAFQDGALVKIAEMLGLRLDSQVITTLAAGGTDKPEAYNAYLTGLGYMHRLDLASIDRAIALFQEALGLDPEYVLACTATAKAYLQKYQIQHDDSSLQLAAANAERALKLNGSLATVRSTWCSTLIQLGRYEEALSEVQQALKIDPQSDEAYRLLAHVHVALGRPDKAEAAFRQAIALKPEFYLGYNNLGQYYLQQARYDDAVEQFQKLVALIPDSSVGYLNLGAAYLSMGRLQDARRMLERSIEILPEYGAYMNLGTLAFTEERFDDAARFYEEALALEAGDYRTWGNLGLAYHYIPSRSAKARIAFQQAITRATEALKLNPRDAAALLDLASYLAMLGERDQALPRVDEALKLEEPGPETMALVGEIHEELGDRERALEWIRKACEAGFSITFLEHNPGLQQLRDDPRYAEASKPCVKAEN